MRNPGNDEVIHIDYVKHDPVVRNLGDDVVAHVDYVKHDRIVRNLGDVDVLHVDLRETLSGYEKPRERRSNTHGLWTWTSKLRTNPKVSGLRGT